MTFIVNLFIFFGKLGYLMDNELNTKEINIFHIISKSYI